MELTKQEAALVNFVRGLCFEDLLDAYNGISNEKDAVQKISWELIAKGDHDRAKGFEERSNILGKLADLLGNANADYRDHINPVRTGVIQMIESNGEEVVRLFEIMQKFGVACSLEFQAKNVLDPLIGISRAPVNVDHFKPVDGLGAVIIELGEMEISFEIENHSFSKYVSDCQIDICIAANDGSYAAWFSSGEISSKGIEEVNGYPGISS